MGGNREPVLDPRRLGAPRKLGLLHAWSVSFAADV
jgi:hypothetical protein